MHRFSDRTREKVCLIRADNSTGFEYFSRSAFNLSTSLTIPLKHFQSLSGLLMCRYRGKISELSNNDPGNIDSKI